MKKILLFLFVSFCGIVNAQTGHFISSDRFSSSLISTLCQDRQGSIWVGTDYGLNRFDGYSFATYLHNESDTTSLSVNTVTELFCDRDGRVWVGTNRGLDCFDSKRDCFVHYTFPEKVSPRISAIIQRHDGTLLIGTAGYGVYSLGADNCIRRFNYGGTLNFFDHLYEDSKGRLWKSGYDDEILMRDGEKLTSFHSTVGNAIDYVEQGDELLVICLHGILSYRNGQMTPLNINSSLKDVVLTCARVSENGTIYIGTRGKGVFCLSLDRRLSHTDINVMNIDANTTKINTMIFDRRGNLWLGCNRKGLLLVPLHPMPFANWSFSAQGLMQGSTISSVCEGDAGMTWCTVQGVGIYGFNAQGVLTAHPSSPDAVEFVFRDRMKRYWVGTNDGLYAYDPLTGRSQLKVTFPCDRFNDMTCDDQGRIYISTFSRGFCVYDPSTGALRNHHFHERDSTRGLLCNNWIMGMAADRQGLIWMATASGVSCYDPQNDSFLSQGWNTLLDGIVCFDACELRLGRLTDGRPLNGCIAIGTEEGLYLYDRQTRKVERFPGADVLQNKMISYIVQSNDGDIWCSTSQGIWQYEMDSHTFLGHVSGNGLNQKEYLFGVGLHTDDDRIFFGHNDGLTVFNPASVNDKKPLLDSLRLSAFLVGNQGVNINTVLNGVRVTDRAVSESSYFTLSYLDHTITLAFSQFNFDNPMNVTFEYRVNEGQWLSNPAGKNDFTLSHLQPGTYRICVRALVGLDYTPEKVVIVTIRAPWYRSVPAYILYFLIIVALIVYVNYNYRRHANQQMNEEKMKFLINATHDIRSPLTLIMGPLEKMKRVLKGAAANDDGTEMSGLITAKTPELLHSLDVIERNAQRILNLVNQILDVRKIDKQQMHLHCQLTDIVAFTRGIFKMFEFNAKERHIEYLFDADIEKLNVWIDRNQFDKVVTNLLSNAFKYSHEMGEVRIIVTHTDTQVQLQVIDAGVGLDADSMKHIFDRFYQGNNSRRFHIDGTGIGLNLCKMIVDMHHGTIEAQNRIDGKRGSVFTVSLPLGNAHLNEDEIETVTEEQQEPEVVEGVAGSEMPQRSAASKRRVLIVDDDMEIAHYISTELSHYYKFGISPNGKEGLKELLTHEYDLVISDVMMPEMDGFTMLRMIKTNLNISHLPVIMLTSKADVGNRLEGLERGADAFLAKPFNMEELHMVIENLIQGRQRLKGKFSGAQQQADKLEQPEVKGNDEQLMERIMKAINKNLSDSDFNVEMLTSEVGISRAQLHRKMKEMTGLSTSEFIRNIRLEQAARLLKEQKINVTQVAYTVGFSNLAHFSTIFRKHFGVSPSEYVG